MNKISSRMTVFYKRLLPLLFLGFLGSFVFTGASAGADPLFFVVPLFMTVMMFFVMKQFVWVLADEVFDRGDALVVRNRGEECEIPLGDIMNVSGSLMVNPPRVTLRLATPCRFGDEVSFSPAQSFSLNPFAKCEVAEDLILRVDQARRGHRMR
jgi:hypothetical protein